MIATSTSNSTAPANQQQLPSPTTLNPTSSSGNTSPTGTPPTSTTHNSVLERQLASPLITQQVKIYYNSNLNKLRNIFPQLK